MRCVHLSGQFRGCPRNCKRIADDQQNHWSPSGSLGRWSKAMTREPGNLLPAMSHARTHWAGCPGVGQVAGASAAWGEGR